MNVAMLIAIAERHLDLLRRHPDARVRTDSLRRCSWFCLLTANEILALIHAVILLPRILSVSPVYLPRFRRALRMPWPLSGDSNDTTPTTLQSWQDRARKSVSSFAEPQVLVASVTLTVLSLGSIRAYKSYLRRIPSAEHIKPEMLRTKTIFGKVTSVGDGDNFRLYHTPGGRLGGWGWVPGRMVPSKREELSGQTVLFSLEKTYGDGF